MCCLAKCVSVKAKCSKVKRKGMTLMKKKPSQVSTLELN